MRPIETSIGYIYKSTFEKLFQRKHLYNDVHRSSEWLNCRRYCFLF